MHTFLLRANGTFDVGMWLPNLTGRTAFIPMFTVDVLDEAVRAVNALNGGTNSEVHLDRWRLSTKGKEGE